METIWVVLGVVWAMLGVAIGLGLVIFVHELGHFWVARWCGVFVERFSIGFGPVLLRWKRGETEYALSAIPLGGYVKMLGQTDTPEVEERQDDPRSYQNQSVPKRMAIISAGVIMNVIFGFVCFVVAYWMGVKYTPATVGNVVPGRPAWQVGVQPGDRIVDINGHTRTDFEMLMHEVALTNPLTETVKLDIDRDGARHMYEIRPFQEEMKPIIGVGPSAGLELDFKDAAFAGSPAAKASPPFAPKDRIIAVDGAAVSTYREFARKLFEAQDKPVKITVERASDAKTTTKVDVSVEPNYVRTLGLEMEMGAIIAVQDGSPATKAVNAAGKPAAIVAKDDVIIAVDGEKGIDPMRLPDLVAKKVGQPVVLTLLRKGKTGDQEIKVTVVPQSAPTWQDFPDQGMTIDQPLSVPTLGLAYQVLPTIRKIDPQGPAASAEPTLKAGDVVKKVLFVIDDPNIRLSRDPIEIKENQWPGIVWSMQFPFVKALKLTVERAGSSVPIVVELAPAADPTWPFRLRGIMFDNERLERKEESLFGAIAAGLEHTRTSIIRLYLQLRGLVISRTISSKNLGGIITMFRIGVIVFDDFPRFVLFLGLLSINLAIINFLPIPILDGGHMVFLTYEMIMRRQASEKVSLVANYIGISLILSLMVYVIGLDIWRLWRDYRP